MTAEIIPLFQNNDQHRPTELPGFENWHPYRQVARAAEQMKAKAPEPRLKWSDARCPANHHGTDHQLGNYGKCIYCHERPRKVRPTS